MTEFASGVISKIDKAKQQVFGWAYVTHLPDGTLNVDKSGEYIESVEELEKAAYQFVLTSRKGGTDHLRSDFIHKDTPIETGQMIESIVFTPEKIAKMGIPEGVIPNGWWVGYQITDPATWKSIEDGKRLSFSIHGKGHKKSHVA